ncbi:MAG TPA: transglutaminaseTgpA domain-containing protein [Natronosporangium sp.]
MALRMGWAGLLLVAGAWPLSAAWAGSTARALIVAAAVAPLLLFAIADRLRAPAALVATVLLVATGAGGFALAGAGGEPPGSVLRDAIPRLLTAARPAPATPELLLPGIGFAALVGIWVGLRTLPPPKPGGRLVAAPVGGLALYTAGALLSAGSADPRGLVAGALVVVSAAGWLALAGPRPPLPAATGRLAPAAMLALITAVAAGAIAVPDRFEPRDLVEPPRTDRQLPSPLPLIAGWHRLGDQPLLLVDTQPGTRLRLVTLSEFDGSAWSATANYRRPGAVAAESLPPGPDRRPVTAEVTVATLTGPWLPSPGYPTELSLPDVDVEPAAGSILLRTGELRPGLRYTVTGTVDAPSPEAVASAQVPAGPATAPYLTLPAPPWSFTEYARRVTYGASTRFEQAVAIEYAVREGRRHDPDTPAGSSYARLETFLFREPGSEPGAGAGSSEQFATAFAVLARAVGLPTRVVVGFATDGPAGDGGRVVRGVDAVAWPEVYFDQLGWYPFDPTPQDATDGGDDDELKLAALGRVGEQAAAVPPADPLPAPPPSPLPSPPPAAASEPGPAQGFPIARLATVTGVGTTGVLLALLVLVLAGRTARRRRHRQAGDRGAWAEALDLLTLLDRRPAPGQPAPEIAAELAALAPLPGIAPHPALVIAAAADRAAFAPAEPASGRAWRALPQLRRAVRAAAPLRRRVGWPVDPRPLLRR